MRGVSALLGAFAVLLCAACSAGGSEAPASPAVLQQPSAGSLASAGSPELMAQLRTALEAVLAERGIRLDSEGRPIGKSTAALPKREYFEPGRDDPVGMGHAVLNWFYAQDGDYDHNGEVNIADITPIGIHYGAKQGDFNWFWAVVADGDGNGEVNISDVTPIGLNFGVIVEGYVIEAREYEADDWREFGYIDFDAGSTTGPFLEFSYVAPGGQELFGYRVAPVGAARDFAWTVYPLTNPNRSNSLPSSAVLNGLPSIAYVDLDSQDLYFSQAEAVTPQSAEQWTSHRVDSGLVSGEFPPVLAANAGYPSLAYVYFAPGPGVAFAYSYSNAPGELDWNYSGHFLVTPPSGVDLAFQRGLPWLFNDGVGLHVKVSSTAFPTQIADYTPVDASTIFASLGGFTHPSAAISGLWSFACGVSMAIGPAQLVFNRSNVPYPLGPGHFVEFPVRTVGSWDSDPSLALVGGIPCIAVPDHTVSELIFLSAASRTDVNPAGWSAHTITADPVEFEHPDLALLDGRPALCWAGQTLHFAWATVANPTAPADWHISSLASPAAGVRPSLAVVDGLPFIAFCQDNGNGGTVVAVAVAQEK